MKKYYGKIEKMVLIVGHHSVKMKNFEFEKKEWKKKGKYNNFDIIKIKSSKCLKEHKLKPVLISSV